MTVVESSHWGQSSALPNLQPLSASGGAFACSVPGDCACFDASLCPFLSQNAALSLSRNAVMTCALVSCVLLPPLCSVSGLVSQTGQMP